MKILIIDDEEDVRRIARLGLIKIGKMDVVDATNGQEGFEKAASEQPDAILLDVMMPDMDGPETFVKIRENPATAHIPIIFLTAKSMASEIERLKSLGAAGVLNKPFDPIALSSNVCAILTSLEK